MKKGYQKIWGILVFLTMLIAVYIFIFPPKDTDRIDYMISTKLKANLVYDCQQVSQITQVEWWLLTAVFYNLQKDPSLTEILEIADKLKNGSFYPQIINDKNLWAKIKKDSAAIEKAKLFYSSHFSFPLKKDAVTFADTFGAPRDNGRRHEGIDLFAPPGAPIYAVCSGQIAKLGYNTLGGKRIGIRSETGFYYYYAHLQDYKENLNQGDKVKKGDLIGYVGHTGNAQNTDDHLHFGIMTPQGTWINPYKFLNYWFKYTNL